MSKPATREAECIRIEIDLDTGVIWNLDYTIKPRDHRPPTLYFDEQLFPAKVAMEKALRRIDYPDLRLNNGKDQSRAVDGKFN